MDLVLCSTGDAAAITAWLRLKRMLGGAIQLVTAEMLATALRWEHRVTNDGATTAITLADGRAIRSEDVRAALNRIDSVPLALVPTSAAERDYASEELRAFFTSWLHALPGRVWNPATPRSAWRHPMEWHMLAARSGFATVPLCEPEEPHASRSPHAGRSPARMLLVIGETVIGDGAFATPALALSRACAAPILGIALDRDGAFHSATMRPDIASPAAVEALRAQLFSEART